MNTVKLKAQTGQDGILKFEVPATPNQAFGLGRRCLGLQFHLEVDTRSLEAWYVGHAVELGLPGAPSINELRRQAQENAGRLAPAARLALGAALDQLLS